MSNFQQYPYADYEPDELGFHSDDGNVVTTGSSPTQSIFFGCLNGLCQLNLQIYGVKQLRGYQYSSVGHLPAGYAPHRVIDITTGNTGSDKIIARVDTDGSIKVLCPASGQEFSIIDHIVWNH